jgi:hypothetical protein
MTHDAWFFHPYHLLHHPICKRCGKVLTRELWLEPDFWDGCRESPDRLIAYQASTQ